jgi:membrane protease YdiL (CAAX protease family)
MSDPADFSEHVRSDLTGPADLADLPPAAPEPPRKKGQAWLAWVIITSVIGFLLWWPRQSLLSESKTHDTPATTFMLRLQGRYVVGAAGLFGPSERQQLYKQIESLDTGSLGQRLRFVTLAGEMAGSEEAVRRLGELRAAVAADKVPGTPADVALLPILRRLYQDYAQQHLDAPSVKAEEREQLHERLGWFGDLALAPRDGPDQQARAAVLAPAQRTTFALLGGFLGLGTLGLFGFCGLVLFLVLLFAGHLRDGLPGPNQYGGVYAETFALWMALFVGLNVGASRLHLPAPPLLLAAGLMLLSLLLTLAWPLLRGVPAGQLRRDVGLTFGRLPLLEPFLGIACYVMALPLMGVGLLLTVLLMHVQKYLGGHGLSGPLDLRDAPSHPIVGVMGNLDLPLLLQLLLVASVMAPLVEETMFRGFLYRHLRELTGRWGRPLSILASALVVSFVFAVIHPQGWVAIPPLMALATGFSLMREWRGTLVPSMVAHGINNGLLLLMLAFALGS